VTQHLGVRAMRSRRKRAQAQGEAVQSLILVVDDFGAAREVYARLFGYSGFRVAEAESGPEALDKARSLRPDLVLMDLAMPGMDGWEVISQLKADERTRQARIVVITGASYADGAQRAKDAGCDAYLIKPCLPETLMGVARRLLSRRPRTG
jgi:CheY-like chemotaxis protein